MLNLTTIILTLLIIIMVAPVYAIEFHPLNEIQKAATEFATRQISQQNQNSTIEAGHLDPRLKLKRCSLPLSTQPLSQRNNNANMTVIVRCEDTKPWIVYVPVKVKSYLTVAVTNRPLARGIPVKDHDFRLEQRDINRLTNGYFENATSLIGRIPKRSLPKGAVISPKDLGIKKIVSKGSRVSIIAETNGITVRMPGKALTDAGKGDQVRVENLSSGRSVIGVVLGRGLVKVTM